MAEQDLRQLVKGLHDALEDTDEIDDETLLLIRQLDEDIDRLVDGADDEGNVLEQAESLEAEFAARHPVAAGVVREIIDALGRMGI